MSRSKSASYLVQPGRSVCMVLLWLIFNRGGQGVLINFFTLLHFFAVLVIDSFYSHVQFTMAIHHLVYGHEASVIN